MSEHEYPFTDFEAVRAAIITVLGTVAPSRHITRHMRDLEQHNEAHRAAGVFTVLIGPRRGYNYEHRPGDLPKVTFWIYGEQALAGDDPGPQIDEAENAMARDLEKLANQAPENDLLTELVLQSIVPSAQTTPPIASVLGAFVYGVDR